MQLEVRCIHADHSLLFNKGKQLYLNHIHTESINKCEYCISLLRRKPKIIKVSERSYRAPLSNGRKSYHMFMNAFNLIPWKKAKLFVIVDRDMPMKITALFLIKTSCCLELPRVPYTLNVLYLSIFFVIKFVEIPLSHFWFICYREETKHRNIYQHGFQMELVILAII